MIELKNDGLVVSFPEVHPQATVTIELQRTLRVPDDGCSWPLPPGLGRFPVRHVDDFRNCVPRRWVEHGGVMVPVHQSEALWLHFRSSGYPIALKVAAGKINAVTGGGFSEGLSRWPQDYVVVPDQPWLDGYCVGQGLVRQFVAVPLGSGLSAEEQITGRGDVGGLQVLAVPMKRSAYERRCGRPMPCAAGASRSKSCGVAECEDHADMGLAPGGTLRQELRVDPYDVDDWEQRVRSRCFVHLCNSQQWRAFTGSPPPTQPPNANDYRAHGLPWFESWSEPSSSLPGSSVLHDLRTVGPERRAVDEPRPRDLGSRGRWWVREGEF
ncbi:MAG: hypothetical protein Q8O67_31185 [Deltaproteobacteria bacterium]|nr:hypothetical protein [Deltaproteobacteria bacterium]